MTSYPPGPPAPHQPGSQRPSPHPAPQNQPVQHPTVQQAAVQQPAVHRPAVDHPAGYRAALRVATTIAVIKWILIALVVMGQVGGAMYVLATSEGSDVNDDVILLAIAASFVVLILSVVLIWVLFGWFEHVLRVLVSIADHTRTG